MAGQYNSTYLHKGAFEYGCIAASRGASTIRTTGDVAEPAKSFTQLNFVLKVKPATAGGRKALDKAVAAPDGEEGGQGGG